MPSTTTRRLLTVAGLSATTVLAAAGPALAATPTPSPTCKIPSVTVSPTSGHAGSSVTVTGAHFSGCPAKNSTAKPSPVNPVGVGLVFKASSSTAAAKQLATTSTTPSGTFTVTVTIPAGETAGEAALVAVAQDKSTGLGYRAAQPFTITAASTGTATTGSGTGTGTGTVPTSVPAGSGGMAATSSSPSTTDIALLALAGAAGLGLTAAGGRALRRR